jgi:leader peptidase (prepilin peptidase)/N-methyltransferase
MLVVFLLLLLASLWDLRKKEIPNFIPITIGIFSIPILIKSPINLFGFGLAVLLFLISLLSKEESIGGGDIKLIASVGLFLGLFGVAVVVVIAMTGAEIAKKISKKKEIVLAPFVLIGFTLFTLLEKGFFV